MKAQEQGAFGPEGWCGLEELRATLRTYLVRHCSDENDLEDVIQETLLRAARYRSGRRSVHSLKPWAMRIALNVLSDSKRRGSRCQPVPHDDEVFDVPAPEEGPQDSYRAGRGWIDRESADELLRGTLLDLRASDRALLDSYYGGARSTRVSAAECGIPRHLVKIRLFRARRRLQRAMRRKLCFEHRWRMLAS